MNDRDHTPGSPVRDAADFREYHVTIHQPDAAGPLSMFDALCRIVGERGGRIVRQFAFGGDELAGEDMAELERAACGAGRPMTCVLGDGPSGAALTGTQAYAVSGVGIEPVRLDGRVVGNLFADEYAQYCYLAGVRPRDKSVSRAKQVGDAFECMEEALRTVGMDFSNVVRTWMYLAQLLEWYDEFNSARTQIFEDKGVMSGVVAASTGIGVSNLHGIALVADALAIKPRDRRASIRSVSSPLQCPAFAYKSSFSRGVEVVTPARRRLYISGTASIDDDGRTMHPGNIEKQIARTMDVVRAILVSRQMDWPDLTRAIAYFKHVDDVPVFRKYCCDNGIAQTHIALAHAHICRDELLFEIEADAGAG